jgi:hypothetical protein
MIAIMIAAMQAKKNVLIMFLPFSRVTFFSVRRPVGLGHPDRDNLQFVLRQAKQAARMPRDLDTLAKFSLAVLTDMVGLSPADRPTISTRIPFTESRLLPPGSSFGSTVVTTPSATMPKEKTEKSSR